MKKKEHTIKVNQHPPIPEMDVGYIRKMYGYKSAGNLTREYFQKTVKTLLEELDLMEFILECKKGE